MTESTTKRLPPALFDPRTGDADTDAETGGFLAGDADVPQLGAVVNHSLPEVGLIRAWSFPGRTQRRASHIGALLHGGACQYPGTPVLRSNLA